MASWRFRCTICFFFFSAALIDTPLCTFPDELPIESNGLYFIPSSRSIKYGDLSSVITTYMRTSHFLMQSVVHTNPLSSSAKALKHPFSLLFLCIRTKLPNTFNALPRPALRFSPPITVSVSVSFSVCGVGKVLTVHVQ